MSELITTKRLFERDDVKRKFTELLGKRATSFITSVLQIVSQNELLSKADPASVYHAAAVAATLDLPLNSNLGFAYIVAYNQRSKDGSSKQVAQFQMGYKGFIQLAQRSGQFKTIAACAVYEGQLVSENPLTGYEFDFKAKKSDLVIGYAAYFKLINGFEKTLYMTVDELKKHGMRFSKTFQKGNGLWKDDFDSMSVKTVLKRLLSKYAPLSVDMQKAVIADQSVINDEEANDVTYIDNEPAAIDKEAERMALMVSDCETVEELEQLKEKVPNADEELFKKREEEIRKA